MTTSQEIRDRLDELEAARAAATKLPWGHHPQDPSYIIGEVGGTEDEPEWLDVGDTGGRPPGYPGSATADAALIVAAVNALPQLTAAVRAMANLADVLDYLGGDDRQVAAHQIRRHLADALTAEEAAR